MLSPGEAYCIKCKTGQIMKNAVFGRYKNNMPVERGTCTSCGTKISRMLSKEEALKHEIAQMEKSEEGDPD